MSWNNIRAWWFLGAGLVLPLIGTPLAFETMSRLLDNSEAEVPSSVGLSVSFAVGVAMTLVGLASALYAQRRSNMAVTDLERNRTQSVTRFTDELGSTLDVLVEYSLSDGQRDASDKLILDVLREGRRLFAHEGVRLCLYMLEEELVEGGDEGRHGLVLRDYDGRRDAPRDSFLEGPHSASLIEIARGNRAVAVVDPDNPPAGIVVDHSEHSGWQSYLAVPVMSNRSHLGILLIDTRDRVDFGDQDKSIGWTIARLIAHGLRATERQALETRDEVDPLLVRFVKATGA